MRREQGLAVLLEVFLIFIEHAVEPWKQFLRTMVGVQDDGNAVGRGYASDVMRRRNGTVDRCELVGVGNALSSNIQQRVSLHAIWRAGTFPAKYAAPP